MFAINLGEMPALYIGGHRCHHCPPIA